MQTRLNNIWNDAKRLSRLEKIKLLEKLAHQLRIEDEKKEKAPSWNEMYGVGKGVWNQDAQEYVDQLREDRF